MAGLDKGECLPSSLRQWRWTICGLLLLATMLNYMDRQTLAQLAPTVKAEFHLNNDQYGELEIADSLKLSIGRPPGRPFTRKKFAGEALLDSATADDMPPGAELFGAPLPSDEGTASGERAESAYSLLGGVVLNCPARRQWTLRGA